MKRLVSSCLVTLLCAVFTATAQQQQPAAKKPFTIDDLITIKRVGDPQLSPDGRQLAFTITETDAASGRRTTQIYLMPTGGGEPRQLTRDKVSSGSPRWSPDGKTLAFVSARETGGAQIWVMDAAGGDARRVTDISTGADAPLWSPDGKLLAFVSEVYPDCQDDACNKGREAERAAAGTQAKIADRLLYRHWTSWKEGKRSHVFVVAAAAGGAARDLTPGDYDAPPFSLGGPLDYAFSPDSRELAFARNTDKVEATSTNGDIFVVPVAGGEPQLITGANKANDLSPQYSPDGRYIAYRAQTKPGFESDRWQLMLYDRQTKRSRSATAQFDGYVETFVFTSDSKRVVFVSPERGRQPVFSIALDGNSRPTKLVAEGGVNDELQLARDDRTLVFTRNSAQAPSEIYSVDLKAANAPAKQLTRVNDQVLQSFDMKPLEEVEWTGADGARVHGWIAKPPGFDASKKWPLLVLIHGGPQGAFNDAWSYRWNPQVFAAAGYVVFLPNPRGSTGYGQKFTDEISGDWGGRVVTDIKEGVARVLSMNYVDKERVGAAGASYGGYMVNWILGHNDDPRFRYKALVSHAGVYNLTSMYGATEELWFTEWEFKGTPWDNPELYEKWSPHLFVKNFQTPTLVTHGELDYRVPVGEGLQLFTALQKRNVPSKLLYFPDEGHWILKAKNSKLWYDTVLGWFDQHLKRAS